MRSKCVVHVQRAGFFPLFCFLYMHNNASRLLLFFSLSFFFLQKKKRLEKLRRQIHPHLIFQTFYFFREKRGADWAKLIHQDFCSKHPAVRRREIQILMGFEL